MTSRPTTTAYIATSLDGFIARSDGGIDWLPEPEPGEDYGWAGFIETIDAIVMGRATFDTVAGFGVWPYEGTPVFVLSRTMKAVPPQLEGRAETSSMEPRALLLELAAAGHERIYVDGGRTIQSLLRADLLDELVVTTIPVLLGQGIPLFGPLDGDLAWEHLSTEAFDAGLVKSSYRRIR